MQRVAEFAVRAMTKQTEIRTIRAGTGTGMEVDATAGVGGGNGCDGGEGEHEDNGDSTKEVKAENVEGRGVKGDISTENESEDSTDVQQLLEESQVLYLSRAAYS